jgi:hypothetical protein
MQMPLFLFLVVLALSGSNLNAVESDSPNDIQNVPPTPQVVSAAPENAEFVQVASPAPKKNANKSAWHRDAKSTHTPATRAHSSSTADWRFLYEEARNLLVADQKYLIQFEDEENYGKAAGTGKNSVTTVFASEDVEKFKHAVQNIADYRNQMRNHCATASAHSFMEALDKYAYSLCAFNRRALPLVADISENNSLLRLLVSRTSLKDAPVLISRYLQFKKQRFKDSMDKFVPADKQLVEAMVNVANVLKVELIDEDWNRPYGLRDTSVELVSLWPRENIFEATAKLSESREAACIIRTPNALVQESALKTRSAE